MLRGIAASYWTALALGVAALALHVRWYTVDKVAGGEVVSGFGAALVVLGVFVGSRPYIRAGLVGMIHQQLFPGVPLPIMTKGGPEELARVRAEHEQRVEAAARVALVDVLAERVVAVAVVILGTLLNGYGPLVARLLHLRGS